MSSAATTMPAPGSLPGESWLRRRLRTRAEYYRAPNNGSYPEPTEYPAKVQSMPVNAPQGRSVLVADLWPTAAATEDAETGPDADA